MNNNAKTIESYAKAAAELEDAVGALISHFDDNPDLEVNDLDFSTPSAADMLIAARTLRRLIK